MRERDSRLRSADSRSLSFFDELVRADEKFQDFYFDRYWGTGQKEVDQRAQATVQTYINITKRNREKITENFLMDPKIELHRLDPVFAVLLRAIIGPQIITSQVFTKIRKSWCHGDLPEEIGNLIQIKDNANFIKTFEKFRFYPGSNIKLSALQKIGVAPLVDESKKWKDQDQMA